MTDSGSNSAFHRVRARALRIDRSTLVDAAVVLAAWAVGALRIFRYGVGFDDVSYAAPAQQITLEAWRQGRLALWSNTIFGGTPHLGNLQTAALYPGHLLAAPFPDLIGAHVQLAAHLLLFGFGLYLLGRRLGFARPAPTVMAVAAMWSGATIFRAPLLVHFPPLAWVPIAAVCVHAVVTSTRPLRAVAAMAVVVWCILISGHPQSVLMAYTFLGAWALGLIIEHRSWRRIGSLAGAGALSLVLAAPVLFALRQSLAAAADSARDEETLLNPAFLVQLRLFPRIILGEPFTQLNVLLQYGERITFAGVTVVALSLVGAISVALARRWSLVAVALVGVFAASLSLGPRSPTLRFARAFLPGFDQPRASARWNWVLVMAMIVLAGAGIDRLRRGTFRVGGGAVAFAGVLVAIAILVGVEDAGARNTVLWVAITSLVVALSVVANRRRRLVAATLLATLALFELAMPIGRLINEGNSDITETSQLIGPTQRWLAEQTGLTQPVINGDLEGAYVVAGLRPNANSLAGVRMLDGYDGGISISRRWHAALLQVNPSFNDYIFAAQLPPVVRPAEFARLGIRFVLYDPVRGPASTNLPGWVQRDTSGYLQVFENPRWQGDVTAWYATQAVASPEAAGNSLRTQRSQLGEVGLVEDSEWVRSCSEACSPSYFSSRSSQSGQRDADVSLMHDAVVAFNEQFDEGWTVTIDGRNAPVIPVDGVWAGVAVQAGDHHIELRYEPAWVGPSLVLMASGWLGVAALCCWHALRRRSTDTI